LIRVIDSLRHPAQQQPQPLVTVRDSVREAFEQSSNATVGHSDGRAALTAFFCDHFKEHASTYDALVANTIEVISALTSSAELVRIKAIGDGWSTKPLHPLAAARLLLAAFHESSSTDGGNGGRTRVARSCKAPDMIAAPSVSQLHALSGQLTALDCAALANSAAAAFRDIVLSGNSDATATNGSEPASHVAADSLVDSL
jgi:hypothetical protein